MSEHITEIKTVEEFRQTVKSGTVLVDFFATWCPPCRAQLPILEELAAELGDRARIVKIDTDELGELAQEFEVANIPTLVLLRDGRTVERFVGLQQGPVLKSAILG